MPASRAATIPMTLIGGPTVVFDYAGLRIVTDPTFDEPRVYEPEHLDNGVTLVKTQAPALKPADLGEVHVVLASHDHLDNLDLSGRAWSVGIEHVFTTEPAARVIPGASVLADWESVTVTCPSGQEVTITAVPAEHGPDGVWQKNGPVIGFVLNSPGEKTVYISGDNSSVDVVRRIADRFSDIDIAILFAGGAGPTMEHLHGAYITLSDEAAVEAARVLGDAMIVPIHADSWEHFTQSIESMKSHAEASGIGDRVIALSPGETVNI